MVLATNVAETSLTVPGHPVRRRPGNGADLAVLHPARRSSGCPSNRSRRPPRTNGLDGAVASRPASASGCTARRTSLDRPAYTDPEILRTNLAAVILQMAALRLGESSASRSSTHRTPGDPRRPSAEEMAMTLAEQLIDKGRKQGIEQGIDVARRILLKQVRSRFGEVPTWWEERVQSASVDELETWSDRVLRVRSIDEVVG